MKEEVGNYAVVIHGRYAGASGFIVEHIGAINTRCALKLLDGTLIPIFRRSELYIIDPDLPEAEGMKHEEVAMKLCQRHQ